jgi:O-acetyl-ADP-ribose deacetylase (regulator of RNase III)
MAINSELSWRDQVRISQGDLTDCALDAIVNAANTELLLGAGVAGAIRNKGGPTIQMECDRIGRIPLGEAAVTTGGMLKAKLIIHAASMNLGGATAEQNLRASTRNALRRAAERNVESIGFPAIGTGIAGFPLERCAQVMIAEVRDHLTGESSVRLVEFVLFDRVACDIFRRVFAAMG